MQQASGATRRAVVLGLAAAGATAPAWAGLARPAWTQTEALLARYVDARKVAGLSVAIRRNGGAPAYLRRGALALDGADADERTIWRVFSMSKPVTGVAAMSLVERRKLRLDQPVADFVPEFAHVKVLDNGAARPAQKIMRIRHLLTHTAGLGYAINEGTPLAKLYADALLLPGDPTPRAGVPKSLDEFGARLATMPLAAEPGSEWVYSVALDLMGLVIQRASGMPFEDYLRTALFEPLGMTDTGFYAPAAARARFSMNYWVKPAGIEAMEPADGSSPYLRPPIYPSGGGGLLSTAQDYSRFCAMLMGGGALDGVRVISPTTAHACHANLLPHGVRAEGAAFGAGMGVVTRNTAGHDGVPAGTYHWGGAAGTTMWMDPVNRLSVVMMTQFMPSHAYPLWSEIRRAIYADLAA